jgi:hypothetical protein
MGCDLAPFPARGRPPSVLIGMADLQFQLPEGLTRDGEYLRIAATNSHAERRGELRVITAVLAVQLPQLSDVHISRSVVAKLVVHDFVVNLPLEPIEG